MNKYRLSKPDSSPQPPSDQKPICSFHPHLGEHEVWRSHRWSDLQYPTALKQKIRKRGWKANIEADGFLYVECPKCGWSWLPGLMLEPLGAHTDTRDGRYSEPQGIVIVCGVYCDYCGLTDIIKIGGWPSIGYETHLR